MTGWLNRCDCPGACDCADMRDSRVLADLAQWDRDRTPNNVIHLNEFRGGPLPAAKTPANLPRRERVTATTRLHGARVVALPHSNDRGPGTTDPEAA